MRQLRAECQAQGTPYKSYVRKSFNKVFRETKHEVDNMCVHIHRGCFCYPLPPHEMSVKIDADDLFLTCCSLHQHLRVNLAASKSTRWPVTLDKQTAERGNKMAWLWITRFNLNKNRKLAKLLCNKTPQTMEWFIREALLHKHPEVSELLLEA